MCLLFVNGYVKVFIYFLLGAMDALMKPHWNRIGVKNLNRILLYDLFLIVVKRINKDAGRQRGGAKAGRRRGKPD